MQEERFSGGFVTSPTEGRVRPLVAVVVYKLPGLGVMLDAVGANPPSAMSIINNSGSHF